MDFIREKIKEKPLNRRRILKNIGKEALNGLVFGLTACLMVALFLPLFRERFLPDIKEEVDRYLKETGTQETETEEPSTGDTKPLPDYVITLPDYQEIQNQLYAIGAEVARAMVTLSPITEDGDWMGQPYDLRDVAGGVIVSEDENYYYILAEKGILPENGHVKVTFADESGAEATLFRYDGNTGIAILTVEKHQVKKESRDKIAVARVGNSYAASNGTVVIAVGGGAGMHASIATGSLTSVSGEVTTWDKNYGFFTTDIIASENAGTILANTKGEIIGMAMESTTDAKAQTLTVVSISEINGVVQRLIQGKDMAYVGLYVSTVTKDISTAYDLPMGVFIKEVKMDSPAMFAGLQSGDIVTKINGEDIYSAKTYSSKIQMLLPGTTCEFTIRRANGNEYIELKCEVTLDVLK